jgi:hypothetical protein
MMPDGDMDLHKEIKSISSDNYIGKNASFLSLAFKYP